MRYSQLFGHTRKLAPSKAETINHKLLVQAGYIRQIMAGVYTYLPLGLRTLSKIRNIIRREMNSVGGQEILMGNLHPSTNWKKTGGWDSIDVLFKVESRTGKEYALAQSHEEIVSPLVKEFIKSYKDLPLSVYQIQWHYRDELRSKSGILRGREFEMKDMYSFHETQEDFERFYGEVKKAYLRTYKTMGLDAKVTEASGGGFSDKISYEFMVITDAGEDEILYCPSCEFCVNTEISKVKKDDKCPNCKKDDLNLSKASEVGNVFDLGQKYMKDFEIKYTTKDGKEAMPIMGCYGWGTSRTMGVIVEVLHDDKGLTWPASVAPFIVQLVSLNTDNTEVVKKADAIYKKLTKAGIEVLYDDRSNVGAGEKLSDADLIGNPLRAIVSVKTGDSLEVKERTREATTIISVEELIDQANKLLK